MKLIILNRKSNSSYFPQKKIKFANIDNPIIEDKISLVYK